MTISTTNVPQYAQGLSVHNPQARTSSITPRTRGNHPKRTSLTVPVGVVPITLEMPPIISMMAEMNSRMAMRVIPRGRLRIVPLTSCRMRSSNREAARAMGSKARKLWIFLWLGGVWFYVDVLSIVSGTDVRKNSEAFTSVTLAFTGLLLLHASLYALSLLQRIPRRWHWLYVVGQGVV